MKNNPEHFPAELFDWMQTRSFESLRENEQKLVLLHMTAETYDMLSETAKLTSTSFQIKSDSAPRLNHLLAHFDLAKQKRQRSYLVSWTAISTTLAAASIIVILVLLRYQIPGTSPIQIAIHDTIYLERHPDTIRIYDTALYTQQPTKRKNQIPSSPPSRSIVNQDVPETPIRTLEEIQMLSGQIRSKSLRDDSLIARFGFVTL